MVILSNSFKQTEGVGFPEAVERLAALAGLPMPVQRPEEKARQQKAATPA